ncbi:hypothetical protein AMELA_G00147630 [Ameiurus melas]|uniref:3CxxC-type domain-containing protein n=1 Tax=Ameiurus melas TaxID=219545 RepID=A0A7J6AGN7_AMEME|nr:hypothetical protein AMELA_G00147630 [Ameiurus melas]
MEALTFSTYNFGGYPGYFPFYNGNPKFKPQSWNKKGTYGVMPEIPDYFEIYKRAQLKAILSQVNPNLTPRLRKANTKEFGVQVNPRVNATVQCSLGPKTLFYREDRFFSVPARADELDKDAKLASCEEGNCAAEVETHETEAEDTWGKGRQCSAFHSNAPTRFNFQFLEQKYGYYHCSKCNIRWESAYVWCISGTCKVYFKQHCRKCQAGLNPYRVESIQCQVCAQTRCCCERKQRHIDIRRPHRQDLCGRCKGKRLSCDTTYSFKYIV